MVMHMSESRIFYFLLMLLAHVAQIWNMFISEKKLEEDGCLTLMPNITDVANSAFFYRLWQL
jgi:hypothetical protein